MTVDMGLSYAQLNNAQSANLAGLAMGCIFFIPLAKKYGRRLPYVVGTAAMAAASWWSSRMTTETELYLTNLFFGLAGATNETLVQMTVRPEYLLACICSLLTSLYTRSRTSSSSTSVAP